MKITGFLLLIFTLNLSATGFGQISMNENGKSVKEILNIIENNTDYRFFYNDDLKSIDKLVDIDVTNQNINQVLDKLFASTEFGYRIMENNLIVITLKSGQQQLTVSGKITDSSTGEALPGVSVVVKGTLLGVNSGADGTYSLNVGDRNAILVFSFVGYQAQEISVSGRTKVDVALSIDVTALEEVIVVGYGTQKKSDITGSVASLSKERLEGAPNLNIAQAIQGSIPGVMIQTTSAGARSTESIMIRGRNSILADNTPLIIVDGIPYGGQLSEINPNDVKSIEVLKDASAAAIYGSRGSNGVILITTKEGEIGKTKIAYDGKFGIQKYINLPDIMNGEQFYKAKMERYPDGMTPSEQAVYDSGKWVDWLDLASRNGYSYQHNLSLSGGSQNTQYFISGNLLDVRGLVVSDDYLRGTGTINVDTKAMNWLTVGTRTHLTYNDMSGVAPSMSDLFYTNPLATAYDENGNLTISPVTDDPVRSNPLQTTLFKNIDKSYQVLTNNYAIVDFPFIKGLSYRLNTGIRLSFADQATYRGRNTRAGLDVGGSSNTDRTNFTNTVLENILSFTRQFGVHNIFATAVYSFEESKRSSNTEAAQRFPNDFLSWYAAAQAEVSVPGYTYDQSNLISQMLRLNYGYDSRYLLTLSVRRDGYSGFGAKTKWGIFPSVALGWNLSNEQFFPWRDLFDELKLRVSYGLNGNQAVGAYQTISRLGQENTVSLGTTIPGYVPSKLGSDNLGWESSSTFNVGMDFRILESRITGAINIFNTNTSDLLLNRTISPVHGITSITQNIGKTNNKGFEFDISSRNIVKGNFRWSTTGNISFVKNKIVSLYGELDEAGNEIDDIVNSWFIGEPIRVNYDYVFDGIFQLDQAEEAAKFGSVPGYVRLKDVNGDGVLSADDRQIIGQEDPKFLWGLTNSLTYRNFTLDIFIHGVHGVTKQNDLRADHVTAGFRGNTTYKNYWTPTNPTNDFHSNLDEARRMSGVIATYYENASFVRVKDVSLSYNVPSGLIGRAGIERLRVFINGRNLFTFTKWGGLDPELPDQVTIPLQKEFVFGLELGF